MKSYTLKQRAKINILFSMVKLLFKREISKLQNTRIFSKKYALQTILKSYMGHCKSMTILVSY